MSSSVVVDFLRALVDDDVEAMRPLVDDGVVWWVPASAAARYRIDRPLVGWGNIPWLGGAGWKGFEPGSSTLTIHHVVAEDDLVAVHYNRAARRTGGGTYAAEYHLLFRLAGGRIAEVWEIVDTAAAFGGG